MNNAPQSSKLDDLLESLQSSGVDIAHGRTNGFEALKTAHSDFLALIEEVIGEDEPYDMNNHATINARNFLRASQRLRKDAL